MPLGVESREEASSHTQGSRPGGARIVVPYTDLLVPETLWALQATGRQYETFDVSESDTSYLELISYLWSCGEGFAIVEHDIVVTDDVLDSFDACDQPWCVASYPYLRGVYWGLGCTRFSASLTRDFPDVIEAVATYEDQRHPPGHWCSLDAAITFALRRRLRAWPCQKHGTVQHLGNQLPTHGCRS